MGTLSGDPSALISLRRIFPSLEATIAVDFGTSRAITRTPSSSGDPSAASRSMVARAGTGGIVLFDTRAESPVASACVLWTPVNLRHDTYFGRIAGIICAEMLEPLKLAISKAPDRSRFLTRESHPAC